MGVVTIQRWTCERCGLAVDVRNREVNDWPRGWGEVQVGPRECEQIGEALLATLCGGCVVIVRALVLDQLEVRAR